MGIARVIVTVNEETGEVIQLNVETTEKRQEIVDKVLDAAGKMFIQHEAKRAEQKN